MTIHSRQHGYALMEVLVAAALAAGVLAAGMASTSKSLNAFKTVQSSNVVFAEAMTIEARLRTGRPIAEVQADFPDWSVTPMPPPPGLLKNTSEIAIEAVEVEKRVSPRIYFIVVRAGNVTQ